jgi:hypothetical protein
VTTEPWAPLEPEEVVDLLASFDGPWWIGGGLAIDLFVGRRTRDHADIDVVVLRDHWDRLRSVLSAWDFRVGEHEVWARLGSDKPWNVEFVLEDRQDNDWVYRRQPEVRLPLREFGAMSPTGIPYERPEVVLLYKSKYADVERNLADLHAALPHLGIGARAWLAGALDLCSPGHPWLAELLER